MKLAIAMVATMLVLAACGSPSGATQSPGQTPTLAPTPRPPDTPPDTLPPVTGIPRDILDAILDEAATQAGVARDQLVIERAEPVTWPDGSLGCPEPDMMYTQVLVDGYWVVIRAGDQAYDFHGSGSSFKLCPPGRGRPPAGMIDRAT